MYEERTNAWESYGFPSAAVEQLADCATNFRTQAAVSRQIALLEEEFGQHLFVRKHRAIEPTAACINLGAT
ncbi:LysR family transcriptional regulator, partial [Rhizobium johnstonii]|uniref:helix-turn-helix domain-containing protein n=1 Tax=Rhizobium johnstonii TaxID=3019933 RepID=UPI003F95A466